MSPLGAACAVTAAFAAPIAVVDLTLSRRQQRTISRVWWDALEPGSRWWPYGVGVTLGAHLYGRAGWTVSVVAGASVAAATSRFDRMLDRAHVP